MMLLPLKSGNIATLMIIKKQDTQILMLRNHLTFLQPIVQKKLNMRVF